MHSRKSLLNLSFKIKKNLTSFKLRPYCRLSKLNAASHWKVIFSMMPNEPRLHRAAWNKSKSFSGEIVIIVPFDNIKSNSVTYIKQIEKVHLDKKESIK